MTDKMLARSLRLPLTVAALLTLVHCGDVADEPARAPSERDALGVGSPPRDGSDGSATTSDSDAGATTSPPPVAASPPVTGPGNTAPPSTMIDSADILGRASADLPFSQQSGYATQVIGTYTRASAIPEAGIHGPSLPNGETLRLGKVVDPLDATRKALFFQLAPTDPSTSGSKRSEIAFGQNVEMKKVYWVALSVYVHDWGTLSNGDLSLFGTQLHSGDNSRGLSPSFSIDALTGGRTFRISARHSTSASPSQSNTTTARYAEQAIPFGRWIDFVFRFRHDTGSGGILQTWMDGTQIVDHKGPLGFDTPGFKDYVKFGYYNWSGGFNSSRKVLLRSPMIVADPTGSKYGAADLRAALVQ